MMKRLFLLILPFQLALISCGTQDAQLEQYPMQSVSDLTLTASNHPHGYSKSECFQCHIPTNIHQVNRINSPNFDLADSLVRQSGLSSCRGCHGTNGVIQ